MLEELKEKLSQHALAISDDGTQTLTSHAIGTLAIQLHDVQQKVADFRRAHGSGSQVEVVTGKNERQFSYYGRSICLRKLNILD